MIRAEQQLDAWLRTHAPKAAERWPIEAMRALRDRIAESVRISPTTTPNKAG